MARTCIALILVLPLVDVAGSFSADGQEPSASGKTPMDSRSRSSSPQGSASSGDPFIELRGHEEKVLCLAFPAGGGTLLSASGMNGIPDHSLRIWDLKTTKTVRRTDFNPSPYYAAVSPDGKSVAIRQEKALALVDAGTGKLTKSFDSVPKGMGSLRFSRDGRRLLQISHEVVDVWDVSSGKHLSTFSGHPGRVVEASFLANGNQAASLGDAAMLRVWDVASGKEVKQWSFRVRGLSQFARPDADDQRLVLITADEAAVWHVDSGRMLFPLEGAAQEMIDRAQYSPDGKRILGTTRSGLLFLWDAATGKRLMRTKAHDRSIVAVAFSPDGLRVASAGDDYGIRVWPLDNRGIAAANARPDSSKGASPPSAESLEATEENLSRLTREAGDLVIARKFVEAAKLHDRAARMAAALKGERDSSVALSLTSAAQLYESQGDIDTAEKRYLEALEICETNRGNGSALALSALGQIDLRKSRLDSAEERFQRAVERAETATPFSVDLLASCLNSLAQVYERRSRPSESATALRRAVELRTKHHGDIHPATTNQKRILSALLARSKQYDALFAALKEQLASEVVVYGPANRKVGETARSLAATSLMLENWNEAAAAFDQSARIERNHVCRFLPALSEDEQLKFLQGSYHPLFQQSMSFALRHTDDPRICGLSAEWIANGKAVAVRALAERARVARGSRDEQVRQIATQLSDVRKRLATSTLTPGNRRTDDLKKEIAGLRDKEQQLSWQLGLAGWAELREDPWVDLSKIRQGIPANAVLIDIVHCHGVGVRLDLAGRDVVPPGPSSYLACLVWPGDKPVQLIDLGPAAPIDTSIGQYLATMHRVPELIASSGEAAANDEVVRIGDVLAQRLLQRLLPHVAGAKHWIISPDGALWLVPWAALRADDAEFVVDRHEVSYLAAGRETAAFSPDKSASPNRTSFIFANPDYDLGVPAADRKRGPFDPLPGTGIEAEAVAPELKRIVGSAPVKRLGKEATESAVSALERPRIVLLSTHGFFEPVKSAPQNPLTSCGLAFAGANRRSARGPAMDDGILTGSEIVDMDLRQTSLVVLSACQTGLGKVEQGEGVAGLRQSFQVAGAQAVLATQWSIPDKETAELMKLFFKNHADGQSRAASLRNAQLALKASLRKEGRIPNPMLWGAFTLTGRSD